MGKVNLAEQIHIVPLTNSAQKTTNNYVAPHINMKIYEKVEFIVMLTAAAAAGYTMTVTQSAATDGSTSDAIASAGYRLTAAAGTDTMGDVTALTTSGRAIGTGDATKTLIVDVDSQDLVTADKPYVGLTFTHSSSADITLAIVALCWPKYPQTTNASALT